MPHADGAFAIEILIDEAYALQGEGRYERAADAGARAVLLAEEHDRADLLARALAIEGAVLLLMGSNAAALVRYTRVIGMAEDPELGGRLDGDLASQAVARAFMNWVVCARLSTDIPLREAFRVLDEGERWLTATGHRTWRCGFVLQRASLHRNLGEIDQAVAFAQEALATYEPHAPGYSLSSFRFELGDILVDAGRYTEASPHYHAILDDPAARAYDRQAAHQGIAECALSAGDTGLARKQAVAAVSLAEALSDNTLCPALEVMIKVYRAASDLDGAWHAAVRQMEAAGRVGGHHRPYFAIRDGVDVALDRGDLETARHLLADLDVHATEMDAARDCTTYTDETARQHRRLAELEAESQSQA